MNKAYNRIVWENEPSMQTPINEANLNRMDAALNEIDNRVLDLDTLKAKQTDLLSALKSVLYDETTGVFTFEWFNGAKKTVDLNVEKIPVDFSMSAAGVITMTNADGTTYTADISELIKTYSFNNSNAISFTEAVDQSGNKTITANIVKGSISEDYLRPDYLADIQRESAEAHADAIRSRSYAIGDTTTRPGEETDNAKYYKEQAEELAQYAKDASVIGNFELDSTGHLVYEDNSVHIFTVDNNGNLLYEVR